MMHLLRRKKEQDKTQYLVHIAAKIKKIKFLTFIEPLKRLDRRSDISGPAEKA